jgi:L,D-peptidoglycan transpeptidase YkuD (ErfK/YbiS/YcfS/YnhG family)
MPRLFGTLPALLALVVAPVAARTPALAPDRAPVCRAGESAVVVDTGAHRLHLCWRGEIERSFAVFLGIDGVDKRREGDNRTPLGTYPLGAPRASQSFHTFVPVAYPTPAQARMGFTGGAIGIHGPPRGAAGLSRLMELVRLDWTAGCIAVATDQEIDEIAAWLRRREVKEVRLVP